MQPDVIILSNWLTTAEAQEATGYSVAHLQRLARDGTVTARKLAGRVWVFDRAALLAHRETAKSGPKGEADVSPGARAIRLPNGRRIQVEGESAGYVWVTCLECGMQWSPNLRPGGKYPRGWRQCPECTKRDRG